MATYIYETTKGRRRTFEIQQSMKDKALTLHPETGQPVRRIITGGFGFRIGAAHKLFQPQDYAESKFAREAGLAPAL